MDITFWRSQGQAENNGTHEIEILRRIVATSEQMRTSSASSGNRGMVALSDLVAKASRRTPAQVKPHAMSILCMLFSQFIVCG